MAKSFVLLVQWNGDGRIAASPYLARMWFDFEWDAREAGRNRVKHGVAFAEACTVFFDPLASIVPDLRHSLDEGRLILFGHSHAGRLLAVMFAEHDPDNVRIFSARPVTRRERQEYEETTR